MNEFNWITEHINQWDIKEEYIEYFKNTVMINITENDSPYDGHFGIPNWKEVLSLRNEVMDTNSVIHRHLMKIGMYETSVEQLKIITFEEYIKEFYPFYKDEKIYPFNHGSNIDSPRFRLPSLKTGE